MSGKFERVPRHVVILLLLCAVAPALSATSRPTDKVSVKEATPKNAAPKEVATKELAPKALALKELAPKVLAAKEAAPRDAAPKPASLTQTVPAASVADKKVTPVRRITDIDAPLDDAQTNRRSLEVGNDIDFDIRTPSNALTGNSVPVSGRASYNNNGFYSERLQDTQGRNNYYNYPTYPAPQPYYPGTSNTNYPSTTNNYANTKSSQQYQYPQYQYPQYQYPQYQYPQYQYPQYTQYPQGINKGGQTYPTNSKYPATTYPTAPYTYPGTTYTYPTTSSTYQYQYGYQYPSTSATYQSGYQYPSTSATYQSGYQYPTYYVQNPSASQGSYGYYNYPGYAAPGYQTTNTASSYYYPRYN